MIKPFKNRTISDKPVRVYRNLGNHVKEKFSIKQDGLVVGHTDSLCLEDVSFVVNPSGKNRAMVSKVRNVHAQLVGRICSEKSLDNPARVSYNPFEGRGFVVDGNEVTYAETVLLSKDGVFCEKFK